MSTFSSLTQAPEVKSTLKKHLKYAGLIFAAVLLLFLYLVYRPFGFSQEISITFGENDLETNSPDLYLEQYNIANGLVSPQMIENDVSFRELYGTMAGFILKPQIYPPDLKNLSFGLTFMGQGADIFAEIPCPGCENALPDIPLYLNGLENYKTKIQIGTENEPIFFYAKEPLNTELKESDSIENWISLNLPQGTPILISDELRESLDLNKIVNPNLDFNTNSETTLAPTFFPGQKFFIQSSDELRIRFEKSNFNSLAGSDALNLEILDLNGNLVAEKFFSDDGITNGNKRSTLQNFSVTIDLPSEGIYQVYFHAIENNNFELSEITFNTDKIVFNKGKIKGNSNLFGFLSAKSFIQLIPNEKNEKGAFITQIIRKKPITTHIEI